MQKEPLRTEVSFEKWNDALDFPYAEENVVFLLKWIKSMTEEREFTQKWLVEHDELKGILHASSFNNLLKAPEIEHKKIKEQAFYKIVSVLRREQNFLASRQRYGLEESAGKDHLFFSVFSRLGMWNNTVRQMAQVLPGFYASYRPSLRYPGAVCRGLVRFVHDTSSGVFRAWELHAYHGDKNSRNRMQRFEGYIWRREYKYLWMDHDTGTKVARTNMVHQHYSEDGRIEELHGITMGTWAGRIYATKVYLEHLGPIYDNNCTQEDWPRRLKEIKKVNLIPENEIDEKVPKIALALIDPRKEGSVIFV